MSASISLSPYIAGVIECVDFLEPLLGEMIILFKVLLTTLLKPSRVQLLVDFVNQSLDLSAFTSEYVSHGPFETRKKIKKSFLS